MEDNKDVTMTDEKVEQATTQKTYTEQDVQNSFNAGVRKANSEWQKNEDYKAFLEWKKNSQTYTSKINELEKSNQELTKENGRLKTLEKIIDSGVKKEFRKFVTNEVTELGQDGKDFDEVLKNYKEENPQYFGETIVKKVQSSLPLTGGEPQANTTNKIMNDILRGSQD